MRFALSLALLVVAIAVPRASHGVEQEAKQPDLPSIFDKWEVMIPMRDGVKLHTEIYTPKGNNQPLPMLLERLAYGFSAADKGFTPRLYRRTHLFSDGYIFVFQDIRGRFGSDGTFKMLRTTHDPKDPKGTDESTDAYDTIDWLIKNVPNHNGRVGMVGVSYMGYLVTMAMVNPHPVLKAVSEQACACDMWLGDDFFHNGAFRLSYAFEFTALIESSKENFFFPFDRFDMYDFYLQLGPLSHVNEKYFHGRIPTWNDFVAHPSYDEFWQKRATAYTLKEPTVPNLNVAGWWDPEDFFGPMWTYERLEKEDTGGRNFLVVGPWNHGSWSRGPGNSLGEIPFHSDTSAYFRDKIEAPWFAYYLHGKGSLPVKEATIFQTGGNIWTSFDAWPPREAQTKSLYFRAGGKLSFESPQGGSIEEFDSYVSDPAHPVPYRHRPVDETYPTDHPGSWDNWLVEDQRFVDNRPDVLTWQTEPLDEEVTLAGQVTAKLFAATTGSDADWIVKLIDVYPETDKENWKLSGYELMIAEEIFRGRYRGSYEKPEPIIPNRVTPFTIDLHTASHVFQKRHRIMVQVQSTWFPLYDRNPQKFEPNVFEAQESDFQKATQTIYRSARYPSSVEIMVLDRAPRDPRP